MGWFRSSALVTVIVGLRYFSIHLASDAKLAGDRSLIGKWFGWWLLVVGRRVCVHLRAAASGERLLDSALVRVIGISIVVIAASWLVLVLNGGPTFRMRTWPSALAVASASSCLLILGSRVARAEAAHRLGSH